MIYKTGINEASQKRIKNSNSNITIFFGFVVFNRRTAKVIYTIFSVIFRELLRNSDSSTICFNNVCGYLSLEINVGTCCFVAMIHVAKSFDTCTSVLICALEIGYVRSVHCNCVLLNSFNHTVSFQWLPIQKNITDSQLRL